MVLRLMQNTTLNLGKLAYFKSRSAQSEFTLSPTPGLDFQISDSTHSISKVIHFAPPPPKKNF